MKKIIIYTVSIIFFALIISGCKKETESDKVEVITTLFPLYDFVREVGKDKVIVSIIIPPGAESHSFEPTPKDIVKINESSLFIYIGEDMEPWAHDIADSITNKNLVILEAGQVVEMIEHKENSNDQNKNHKDYNKVHEKKHNNDHENMPNNKEIHTSEHHHHENDPHIWLDFEINQNIVNLIADELSRIDPPNKEFYLSNAKQYNKKLLALDNEYKETLTRCELKTIMYGGHFAFGYLVRRYGLTHISPYEGFTPNAEPSPQRIIELVENIKNNNIEVLYYEELIDPKVARMISDSTGVTLELLHGAHNLSRDEFNKNLSFITIMQDNLTKLKKGLKYK